MQYVILVPLLMVLIAMVLALSVALLLTFAPAAVIGGLMPSGTEWEIQRDEGLAWKYEVAVGEHTRRGEWIPLRGGAALTAICSAWSIRNPEWNVTRQTAPCLLCEQPSRVGKLTCSWECEQAIEKAKRELKP